jgi:DNA-binding response OmpR family regulator
MVLTRNSPEGMDHAGNCRGEEDAMDSSATSPVAGSGRVLIADDDQDVRILLAAHLEKCGYNVVEFADGEGLLDYVGNLMLREPARLSPDDHVVLDVKMPGLSGLQALVSLRLAGWTNPIVVLTAVMQRDADALRLGADAVLHKPCDLKELARTLVHLAHAGPRPDPGHLSNCSRHLFT